MRREHNVMDGKVCMITGANSGIGRATTQGLANLGATVVMVCRSRERGKEALDEIQQKSCNEAIYLLVADLASQAAIRNLVEDFKTRYSALHVLINNAGSEDFLFPINLLRCSCDPTALKPKSALPRTFCQERSTKTQNNKIHRPWRHILILINIRFCGGNTPRLIAHLR